jgi:hypothetical protein
MSYATIVLGVACSLLVASACSPADRDVVKQSLAADSLCPGLHVPVGRAADSIPHERACSYVVRAMDALRAAKPESVVLAPGDTAAVSAATVDAIAQMDSAGTLIESWWLVTLRLDGKPYNAELRISQKSGEQSIRPVHK